MGKTYPVLREHDQVEEDEELNELCYDLVNVLILEDEDNPDVPPLRKVDPAMADQVVNDVQKVDDVHQTQTVHSASASEEKIDQATSAAKGIAEAQHEGDSGGQKEDRPTAIVVQPGEYLMRRGPAVRFRVHMHSDKDFELRRIQDNGNGTWMYADDVMNPESEGKWQTDDGRLQLVGLSPKKFFLDFLPPNSNGEYVCINNLDEILTKESIEISEHAGQAAAFKSVDHGYDAFDMGSDSDEFAGVDMGSDTEEDDNNNGG